MRPTTRCPLAPLAAVMFAAATTAACGSDTSGDADFEQTPAADEPSETADSPATEVEDEPADAPDEQPVEEPDQETADAGGAAGPLDPEDAIETITFESPGDPSSTVDVGFHGLRVEGETMLLELSFTGEFHGGNPRNIYRMMGGAVYPELNDRENLTQYTVIGSGHDRWSTPATNAGHLYQSGQTAPYWAYYAAPVDDIDTITVTVVPGSVEFEDVEIER